MRTFFLAIFALYISPDCRADNDNYSVTIEPTNHLLKVKTCFQQTPDYLYTISKDARKLIQNIRWEGESLHQNKGYINLPDGSQGCLSYDVNYSQKKDRLNSSTIRQQHPHDTLLEISDWLWKSANHDKTTETNISFIHENGVNVSAPWSLITRNKNKTEYLMKYTPDSWVGYIGFGKFEIIDLTHENSNIQLAIINGNNTFKKSNIVDWIKQMISAVAQISNGFPTKRAQVIVLLQKGNRGAVPWGQVNRHGGTGVLLVVDPDKSQKELMSDWTASHEFSHLLLPYTPYDRWLSEGFASYHQNISRARIGLLDEKSTWNKLLAGFERGQKTANQPNAPALRYAKGRNRMQMYWGGAVIALKADVLLQTRSNGEFTLSKALDKLSDCCLETAQEWSAIETFSELDKITNSQIFTQLYNQEVKYKSYPDYQELLKELGIIQNSRGRITLDDDAPKAHIRKRIIEG